MTTTASRPETGRLDQAGRLITLGALAGPLLFLVWALQALTRDGYDVTRHPMSLLARGDGGFVQVLSFVATGVLVAGLGRGWGLVRQSGVGSTWLPRLVVACGAGLVGAGVFRADPGAGFPRGAPEGMPSWTTTGILHEACFVLVVLAWVAAVAVLLRRARAEGDRRLRDVTAGCFLVVLTLGALPHADSFPVRTVLASAVQLGFLALVAARDRRRATEGRAPSGLGAA